MPLVVIVGHPSSGKTTVAQKIADYLRNRGLAVEVVDDTRALIQRSAYASLPTEKIGRGAIKSLVERLLTTDTIVIVDALNTIKGFRYELHCIARALKTHQCTVFCDVPVERCRQWEMAKPETDRYPAAAFTDLTQRLEVPNGSVRWDRPLFTVNESGQVPFESIETALFSTRTMASTMSTDNNRIADSQFLISMDAMTRDIVSTIVSKQSTVTDGGLLTLPHTSMQLALGRSVTVLELNRLRRTFLAQMKAHPEKDPATSFAQYIKLNLSYRSFSARVIIMPSATAKHQSRGRGKAFPN